MRYTPLEIWEGFQGYTWEVVDLTPSQLEIQLTFENTNYISTNPELPDLLEVEFKNTSWVKSLNNDGKNRMYDEELLKLTIPK